MISATNAVCPSRHPRERGDPDASTEFIALDSRFRGNDGFRAHGILAVALVAALPACAARRPTPVPAPPPLHLDGAATFEHYLSSRPTQFKMRHQVESRFADRDDVIEGFLVAKLPDRFWVHAMSPMGPTLFDVKGAADKPLSVAVYLDALKGDKLAAYLARDIRRIYLTDCPSGSPVREIANGYEITCSLAAPSGDATLDDPPDDSLSMTVSAAGALLAKRFSRAGRPTADISFDDYRPLGSRWLAHRVTLTHATLPYTLTIGLVSADLDFDASRVLDKSEAQP